MDPVSALLSCVSYYSCAVCLALVPATHAVGVWAHCPRPSRPWRVLLLPFTGGNRHVVLQLFGWVSRESRSSAWCGRARERATGGAAATSLRQALSRRRGRLIAERHYERRSRWPVVAAHH